MLHSQSVTSCRCWRTALQKFCHPNAWMDGQAFGQVRWLINRRIPWYQFCRPWLGWASNPICSQSLIRTCRQFYASWDRSVFEEVFRRQCKVILSDEMTCKVRVRHASERRLFYFSQFGGVINLKGVCAANTRPWFEVGSANDCVHLRVQRTKNFVPFRTFINALRVKQAPDIATLSELGKASRWINVCRWTTFRCLLRMR